MLVITFEYLYFYGEYEDLIDEFVCDSKQEEFSEIKQTVFTKISQKTEIQTISVCIS